MSTMSPELALVDPELRAHAVASLPPIYVNAFLEVRPSPIAPSRPAARRQSVSPSAALAYLLVAIVRTLVFEVVVFAAVFAVVLLANVFA
jgi:hypothetical protein